MIYLPDDETASNCVVASDAGAEMGLWHHQQDVIGAILRPKYTMLEASIIGLALRYNEEFNQVFIKMLGKISYLLYSRWIRHASCIRSSK